MTINKISVEYIIKTMKINNDNKNLEYVRKATTITYDINIFYHYKPTSYLISL